MHAPINKKVIFAYLGVVLIWSTTPLAINWSGQADHFLYGVSWRMVIGLLCLLIIMLMTKKRFVFNKLNIALYFFSGLTFYTSMMSVYYGSQFISSSIVALVFAFSTFLTGIFSAIWLKEKSFPPHKLMGLIIAILGLVSLLYKTLDNSTALLIGVFWVMVSNVIYSFSGVMFKKYTVNVQLDAIVLTAGSLVVAVVLYGITLWWVEGRLLPINYSNKMLCSTLYLGVAGSALGYVLFMYILKNLRANQVSLLALVTPVFAMALGAALNNEVISINQYIGTGLVLLGLVFYNFKRVAT